MATTKKTKTTPGVEEQEKNTQEQAQEGQEGAEGTAEGKQPAEQESPAAGENEGAKGGPADTEGAGAPPAEEPAAEAAPEEDGGCDCWVYIGPSLPNGMLNKNHVMRGTRKKVLEYLADIIKSFPQVERLTVSLDTLAEQKMRVKDSGTAAHKYYQDVVSAVNARSKKEE